MLKVPTHPIWFCVFINFLNILTYSGINYWFTIVQNYNNRIFGAAFLALIYTGLSYSIIRNWTRTQLKPGDNGTIFAVFYTLGFLSFSFDLITSIDAFLKPNSIFISNYVGAGDDLVDSIWMQSFVLFDVAVNGILFSLILWRAWKGYSSRSLTIFIWAYFFYGSIIYLPASFIAWKFEELHSVSSVKIWIALIRIILLPMSILLTKQDSQLTLHHPEYVPPKKWIRVLEHLNIFLLDTSAEIIMGRKMGFEGELVSTWSNFIAKNDPGIFLNEKNLIWSYPRIQNWVNLCLIVPTFMVSIYFNIKSRKPSWVWDTTVIQFTFLATSTFIAIVQEIHPETPESFQGNLPNPSFWFIQLFPLLTSGFQLLLMNTYKTKRKDIPKTLASKKKK